ncbi:uncharacterized protein LOC128883508 [Hylaeus volcanicus]|uniref:uncharacterized protein LOC128883508 n=1 Tax=Hylaeus volcanicus TaxID=313075 RepID=UPI0023B8299A|nr:uncharacterized protein LOC128883508 [Hylaeus volcanicus]
MSLTSLSNIDKKKQSKDCLIPSELLEFHECSKEEENGFVSSSCPLSLATSLPKFSSVDKKTNHSCFCDSRIFLKDQNDFLSGSEPKNLMVPDTKNHDVSSSSKALQTLQLNSLLDTKSKKVPVASSEPCFSTNSDFTLNHDLKVQDYFLQTATKLPTFDRWRLYCFRFAFVLEPNIPEKGIRYNFALRELCRQEGLCTGDNGLPDFLEENNNDDPPLLILFRFTNEVVQTTHYNKTFLDRVGCLECVYFIDAFLGCLSIHNTRFLVVVCDSEVVSGFNRNSFRIEHDAPETLETSNEDMLIYRIRQSCLIPFNIPFTAHFGTVENKRLPSSSNKISTCDQREYLQNIRNCGFNSRGIDVETCNNKLMDKETKLCSDNLSDESIDGIFAKKKTLETTHNNNVLKKSLTDHNLLEFTIPAHQRVPIMRLQSGDSNVYTNLVYNHLGDKIGNHKQNVENLLATSFYYSYDTDITNTLQRKRQLQIPFYSQKWPCSYDPYKTTNQRHQNIKNQFSPSTYIEKTCEKIPSMVDISKNDSVNVCLFDVADQRFVWNWELVKPFLNCSIDFRWTVPIIQGSVTSGSIQSSSNGIDLVLICRRNRARSGTRFNHRGIDDYGEVANFNESEQLIAVCNVDSKSRKVQCRGVGVPNSGWSSYVQIRGSVPLFWEQSSGLSLNVNINLTRQIDFATQAFVEHQRQLSFYYGHVLYVDLLSASKGGENKLSSSLRNLINYYNNNCTLLKSQNTDSKGLFGDKNKPAYHIRWDCHQQIKLYGFEEALTRFVNFLRPQLKKIKYYSEKSSTSDASNIQYQEGCLRTNCLDCLDRTNAFQWFICWDWIHQYLVERNLGHFLQPAILGTQFDCVQKENNDSLSTRNPWPLESILHQSKDGQQNLNTSFVHVSYRGSDSGSFSAVYRLLNYPFPLNESNVKEALADHNFGSTIKETDLQKSFCKNIAKEMVARMWADQGDRVSRVYTGTDSVMSGVIRQGKSSLATNMIHMFTSLGRFYQNNFEDDSRQDAIEILLREQNSFFNARVCKPKNENNFATNGNFTKKVSFLEKLPLTVENHASKQSDGFSKTSLNANQQLVKTAVLFPSNIHEKMATTIPLRIWYGTWNMGGTFVPQTMEHWLFYHLNASGLTQGSRLADIYVIAVQELVELSKVRVLLSQGDLKREELLEETVKASLGPQFIMLNSQSLVGLYLAVFVRSTLRDYVTHVYTSELKLGFKGQMGNKGAIFLRLEIGDISFCFVNVHLSSGQEKARQRREQLQIILESNFQSRLPYSIKDHDYILMGGDFNFRCSGSYHETIKLVKQNNWKELLFYDQLVVGKRLRLAPFALVTESLINFPPTYKFKKEANQFDESRSPGWCDRILYFGNLIPQKLLQKNTSDFVFKCVDYSNVPNILTSDHKPVYGVFEIGLVLPEPSLSKKIAL